MVISPQPLFYVLWRAWSHWRGGHRLSSVYVRMNTAHRVITALKSSQYLKSLISNQQLMPKQSPILDELYSKHFPIQSDQAVAKQTDGERKPQILINEALIRELLQKFELEEQAGTDLRRAVSQLEARLKAPQKPAEGTEV